MKDFRFFRVGGVNQLRLETVEDLKLIKHFDKKLWVVLSAPVGHQAIDRETLVLMDEIHDGRFRCSEVIAAVEWILEQLKDTAALAKELDYVKLSQVDRSKAEGKAIVKGMEAILAILGKKKADAVDLGDVLKVKQMRAEKKSLKCPGIQQVEKLIRYHRDIFRVVNNFVSLPHFYDYENTGAASFQSGVLYMDGCSFQLCMDVEDVEQHRLLAEKAGIFLVYCQLECLGKEQRIIVAAVTAHHEGRITHGMHGVFYDREGNDWEAKVVGIISNPTSLSQAIMAPFKNFFKLIGSQVEKLSTAHKKALESNLEGILSGKGKKASAAAKPSVISAPSIGGVLAGGGVAIAALGSAFAFVSDTFSEMDKMYLLYTALGVLGLMFIPSIIVGWVKLRRRDLGMVLQAGGWAVNKRMRLSRGLSRHLTKVGRLP